LRLNLRREFQLLGVLFVLEGLEVGAAAGFVEAGGAYDYKLLRLAEALGVDGGLAADHADGGELGDLVSQRHQRRNRAKWFIRKGRIEPSHKDALAKRHQLKRKGDDRGIKKLDLVDADDFYLGELRVEGGAKVFDRRNSSSFMGLGAVRGDGRAVVAEVDVGLEAGDALAGDAGALEAADELFGLAREHGAGDDFEDAGDGRGLLHSYWPPVRVGALDNRNRVGGDWRWISGEAVNSEW